MAKDKKEKKSFGPFLTLLVIFLTVGPTAFPNFFWHGIMIVDYMMPTNGWKMFNDPYVERYHEYLISRLPDIPEKDAVVLPLETTTKETLRAASHGYTVPVIVRKAAADVQAITKWTNQSWWIENYGDEEVLCKYVEGIKDGESPACTIKDAIGSIKSGDRSSRMYVSGESKLFVRRPELEEMVQSPFLDSIAPGKRVFTQLFMGFPGMGSDVHAAIGCNLFRMITGSKKWWLMPVSQTPYVFGSINANGFSAHTKTRIGKAGQEPAPWLKKIERYTITLQPGDLLLNTAWYWHGIINVGEDPDELVIGVPTRYAVEYTIPAFKSNFVLTTVALAAIQKSYGGMTSFLGSPTNLQDGIEKARNTRAAQSVPGTDAPVSSLDEVATD